MSTFTQRGSLLNRYSGFSVAVSGDGNVMACMGSAATTVEIYDRSGSAWVQRGSALSTTSEGYGTSVALNSDGTVLIVGAPNYSTNRGRVYTYDWTGSAWSLRGTTLIASDGVSYDYFGVGVAISQDGLGAARLRATGAHADKQRVFWPCRRTQHGWRHTCRQRGIRRRVGRGV